MSTIWDKACRISHFCLVILKNVVLLTFFYVVSSYILFLFYSLLSFNSVDCSLYFTFHRYKSFLCNWHLLCYVDISMPLLTCKSCFTEFMLHLMLCFQYILCGLFHCFRSCSCLLFDFIFVIKNYKNTN